MSNLRRRRVARRELIAWVEMNANLLFLLAVIGIFWIWFIVNTLHVLGGL